MYMHLHGQTFFGLIMQKTIFKEKMVLRVFFTYNRPLSHYRILPVSRDIG